MRRAESLCQNISSGSTSGLTAFHPPPRDLSSMSLAEKLLALFSLLAWLTAVLAVPYYEGVAAWNDIGSLVPGMTALEAVGPNWGNKGRASQYFTIDAPQGMSHRTMRILAGG